MKVINISDWKSGPLRTICRRFSEKSPRSLRGIKVEFRSCTGRVKQPFVASFRRPHTIYLLTRTEAGLRGLDGGSLGNVEIAVWDALSMCFFPSAGVAKTLLSDIRMDLKPYYAPKPVPKSGTIEAKLWYAKDRLKLAQRRVRLANTILKKWKAKVGRLERSCVK